MKEVLVSIIIPVYNVQSFLKECLDSVLNQTYERIEIILVDDGSTDESGKICDIYQQKDSRIIVIHKKNGGLSDARNAGIEKASGEYYAFIDSDDFVHKEYIKSLLTACIENQSDISVCGYFEYIDDSKMKEIKNIECSFSNIEAVSDFLHENNSVKVMTWNKLYHKRVFQKNNVRFPIGKLHEDNLTTYKCLFNANRISIISNALYFYRIRQGSIMNKYNKKRFEVLESIKELREYVENPIHDFKEEIDSYELSMSIALTTMCIENEIFDDDYYRLINIIKETYSKITNKGIIPNKIRLYVLLIKLNEHIFRVIRKKIINRK